MINKCWIWIIVITLIFLILDNRKREDFVDVADIFNGITKGIKNVKKGYKKIMNKIPPGTPINKVQKPVDGTEKITDVMTNGKKSSVTTKSDT